MRDTTDIYVSTGGDFELVHSANAWGAALVSTSSSFYLTLFDDSSTALLTSQDGRTWSQILNPPGSETGLAGYGFVLARVEDFDPERDNQVLEPSTQWFRAEVE